MRDLGFEKSKAIAHDRITDSERIAIVEPISNPERRTANREHIPDPQRVPQPERIPNPASQIPTRYKEVARVLIRVFALNLAVALAKIIFGYSSGAISVLSDGFHSLTDGASNVVGLVGVYAARQPPDADHPYGHRKYETVAASVVTLFLLLVVIEVLRNAVDNLPGRTSAHEITFGSFAVMLSRALLYTAITRAQQLCVLVGERRAVAMAVARGEQRRRHSALAERIAAARQDEHV